MTMTMDPVSGPTVGAARALIPTIRAAREALDAERTLPQSLVEGLREIGVWRMTQPRAWGGPELDMVTQFEVLEALSEGDGSVGWCAYIGSTSGYWSQYLDDAVGRALYPDLDLITGGSAPPRGRAVIVDGGYRVSGRWPFGSGVKHSSYMISGCFVHDAEGPKVGVSGMPETNICFIAKSDLEVVDNWDTLGLRGTGSHDYVVEDVFVPAEHTFDLATAPIRRTGALYATRNMLLFGHSAVPLGIARAAINETIEILESRVSMFGQKVSDSENVRAELARAEATLGSARSYCIETFADVWETLERGDELSNRQRALYRLAILRAHEAGVETVHRVVHLVGTTAIRAGSSLERAMRDVITANQHVVASPVVAEGVGAMLLGGEPAPMF